MKCAMALFFSFIISNAAIAGDHWDDCSNADGSVRLSDGVLTVGDSGEVIEYSGEAKVLSTVKEEETTCILKDSGETATVMKNIITVEELTYALEEDGPASAYKEIVICQRGAGNLVPQEFCKQ